MGEKIHLAEGKERSGLVSLIENVTYSALCQGNSSNSNQEQVKKDVWFEEETVSDDLKNVHIKIR